MNQQTKLEIKQGVNRYLRAVHIETPEHLAMFDEKFPGKLFDCGSAWVTSFDGVLVGVGNWLVWCERAGVADEIEVYTDEAFHTEVQLKG